MTAQRGSLDGDPFQAKVAHAQELVETFRSFLDEDPDTTGVESWLASLDTSALVGARHHTVPRFLLKRWADRAGRLQVWSKADSRGSKRNINDLAFKDFYTVVNDDGTKSSAIESALGLVERPAAAAIDELLNPFSRPHGATEHLPALAQFAAYQVVRTTRHRRELELHADWFAKTMISGEVDAEDLAGITVVPHQNELIGYMAESSERLYPLFACRPLALVCLDKPLLLVGDEPVVVNGPVGERHHPDCFLTDQQMQARFAKERRRKAKKRRDVSRVVHFASTMAQGYGVADEVLLPISPRAVLLWGPLGRAPYLGAVERVGLTGASAARLAERLNDTIADQALDWIVGRAEDRTFLDRTFPQPAPLMRVCDGVNAASLALNRVPERLRPSRLWT